ncbi:MAG: heavy metal translocating P-type ATPase [Planctomycetota bacterium]|jgi:Cu2+-exporting ATPase|nr:heavy metal translocating P-type ATPase [Planctomycetota bacterium]
MRYEILHDIPGRLRVHCGGVPPTRANADAIGELLSMQEGILSAELSVRTGNMLVRYSRIMPREQVLAFFKVLEPSDWEGFGLDARVPPSLFEMTLCAVAKVGFWQAVRRLILPPCVRYGLILLEALPYVFKGVKSLVRGRLDIAVLDASALSVLAARRDFSAIRTILWMFKAADALEEWTREESRNSLAESLELKIDSVWVRTPGGDMRRPLSEIRPGDLVVAQTGSVIPVDGVVAAGDALVNQSALTGESEAAHKGVGLTVFAGTVVDKGALVVRVEKAAGETRLQGIVKFIEESESLKAEVQSRAERMAEAFVPYSIGLALAVLALTRNPVRASAVLMVDYSCAIRMAAPLTILGAIREGVKYGVLIKGGKHIESLALADTLALDKTGTLTHSRPSVADVAAFDGWDRKEVLRVAACIEEHFPHPVGRAVVRKAEQEHLRHRERHAEPKYILAHGIVSILEGRRIVVGSDHFVFDDNGAPRKAEADRIAESEAAKGRSLLYLAYDGNLVGMLAVEDPIRDDAAPTLAELAAEGMGSVTMLTGDGERTAGAVAAALGIGEYRSGLLPADKANLINAMKRDGRRVVFVGDGVNDSPALSAADVGVSLKDGADIAKEVAGVVLVDGRLSSLATARKLSALALERINRQFGFIMVMNSLLIGLGLFGAIAPRLAAVLHNLGTVLVTVNAVKPLLPPAATDAILEMPE